MDKRKLCEEEKKKAWRREQKKLTMRRLREKLKQNPLALEEKRRKDRNYYYRKKEKGLVKTIKDLTTREQNKLRKKWREEAKLRRQRKKMLLRTERLIEETTPPSTPNSSEGSPSLLSSPRPPGSRAASPFERIPPADTLSLITSPCPSSPVAPTRLTPTAAPSLSPSPRPSTSKAALPFVPIPSADTPSLITSPSPSSPVAPPFSPLTSAEAPSLTSSPRPSTSKAALPFVPMPFVGSRSMISSPRASNLRSSTIPSPVSSVRSPSVTSHGSRSRVAVGKIIAAKNRRDLKAENFILKLKLKAAEAKVNKYRMRENRMKENERRKETDEHLNAKKKKIHRTRRLETEKKIHDFLEDDENSRLTAGKKETITRKSVKKQIRYLNDTLHNLYDKFIETTRSGISYTTFCRCRPFWVVQPKVSARETCLCSLHENTHFMVQALKSSKVLNENSALELAQSLCCDRHMKEKCLERTCENCITKGIDIAEHNDEDSIYYYRWVTKKFPVVIKGQEVMRQKTVKEKVLTTKKRLIECLRPQMLKFMQHLSNIFHQTQSIRHIKNNMSSNTGLLHIDFSENFNCKYAKEAQGAHFAQSKPQLSLHTSVFYYKSTTDDDSEIIEHKSFCTVSMNTQHDPILICAHLKPVLDQIKTIVQDIKTFHFVSDGPTTQYRNRKMFLLMVEYISAELNVEELHWHFSESGHGKGAPDGVGGCLKREADAQVAFGRDVLNTEDFVDCLQGRVKNIDVIPIDDRHVSDIEHRLEQGEIKPFKGTMRIHELAWSRNQPRMIHARRLSCLQCPVNAICHHYEIGQIPVSAIFYNNEPKNKTNQKVKGVRKQSNKAALEENNTKITKKNKKKEGRKAYRPERQIRSELETTTDEEEEENSIELNPTQKRWNYFDIYSDSSDDELPLSIHKVDKLNVVAQPSIIASTQTELSEDAEGESSAKGVFSSTNVGKPSVLAENVEFDSEDESVF